LPIKASSPVQSNFNPVQKITGGGGDGDKSAVDQRNHFAWASGPAFEADEDEGGLVVLLKNGTQVSEEVMPLNTI